MILESIVSTLSRLGRPNFAPMGVELAGCTVTVRPFINTHTFQNLRETGCGVINFTGDVYTIARCALDEYEPPWLKAPRTGAPYMVDVLRYEEFRVKAINDSQARAVVSIDLLGSSESLSSAGLNRAVFAVLEVLIVATRLSFYERSKVESLLKHYGDIVEKTGGEREKMGLAFASRWINRHWGGSGFDS